MIHPVFRLAASQPQLLVEHAAAYASLFGEELAIGSARLRRQLALQVVGLACLMVAAVLLGVGVLLWAALPDDAARVLWLFGITPGLPALLGLWAFWLAGREVDEVLFASLRRQLAEDAALLRYPEAP
jgi:uncharacterized membrane protein YqjE